MAKKFDSSSLLAMGAGAVALAASTYYLFGPEGKIHRKKAAGWMLRLKGEIVERLEEAQELSEAAYHNIVDAVVASQAASAKISEPELAAFAANLKGQWGKILKSMTKKTKPTSKKSVKKSAGKTSDKKVPAKKRRK